MFLFLCVSRIANTNRFVLLHVVSFIYSIIVIRSTICFILFICLIVIIIINIICGMINRFTLKSFHVCTKLCIGSNHRWLIVGMGNFDIDRRQEI